MVRQAGVVAVRDGELCLVESRRGHLTIPKGRVEPSASSGETALLEAWEEAGLTGVLRRALGTYTYEKLGQTCHVLVYQLEVLGVAETWPEQHLRHRSWYSVTDVYEQVIPELAMFLSSLTDEDLLLC